MRVLPWLTMGATLLFAFGKKLAAGRKSIIEHETAGSALAGATLFQLAVAVYGGYFGGGMGIVMLAMLAALGMTDIHAMNALKRRRFIETKPVQVNAGNELRLSENLFLTRAGEDWLSRHGKRASAHRPTARSRARFLSTR